MWLTVVFHCAFSIFQISVRQKLLAVAQHEQISRVRRHICWFAFRFESTSCFIVFLRFLTRYPALKHRSTPAIIQFDILNVDLSWWDKLCPMSTLPCFMNNGSEQWPTTITKNGGAVLHRGMRRCLHHSTAQKHMKLTRLCNYTQFTVLTPRRTTAEKLAARADKLAAK